MIALELECKRRVIYRLPPLPDAGAALALTLLDSSSAPDRLSAARILEHVLQRGGDATAVAAIHLRARKRLRTNFGSLELKRIRGTGCFRSSALPLFADDPITQVVLTSARLGNRELFAPLADQLREFPSRRDAHTDFLLQCLYRLAPFTSPAQAARLFKPLAPYLRPLHRIRYRHPTEQAHRTLFRLYGTVDTDLLPLLERWHTGRFAPDFWRSVTDIAEHLSNERIERLLSLAPERGTRIAQHQRGLRKSLLVRSRAQATAERTATGNAKPELPQERKPLSALGVVSSTIGSSTGPHAFAVVRDIYAQCDRQPLFADGPMPVDAVQNAKRAGILFATTIRTCTMRLEQLPELTAFASDDDPAIAVAAATRAHWLSAPGRDWCREVLTKVCARESLAAKIAALKQAVQLGIVLDNWQATAAHLLTAKNEHAQLIATAARIRFAELVGEQTEQLPAVVIQMVLQHADLNTLRKVVRHIDDFELLRYTTNAPTTIAMIQHAASFPHWPKSLERRVLHATTDAFPSVRRAAYAALATRDRSLSAGAWLAYEACFDTDESVRMVAPDAGQVTRDAARE